MTHTLSTIQEFQTCLKNNEGIAIFKFGAEWCSPCKKVEPLIHDLERQLPNNAKLYYIDVDEAFELYAFMKNKKMLKGIPALLMYKKGNENYVFDDSVNSSDEKAIHEFFKRCHKSADEVN